MANLTGANQANLTGLLVGTKPKINPGRVRARRLREHRAPSNGEAR
jgi:hypothetical protein